MIFKNRGWYLSYQPLVRQKITPVSRWAERTGLFYIYLLSQEQTPSLQPQVHSAPVLHPQEQSVPQVHFLSVIKETKLLTTTSVVLKLNKSRGNFNYAGNHAHPTGKTVSARSGGSGEFLN